MFMFPSESDYWVIGIFSLTAEIADYWGCWVVSQIGFFMY